MMATAFAVPSVLACFAVKLSEIAMSCPARSALMCSAVSQSASNER
jgi:hypothetical protein